MKAYLYRMDCIENLHVGSGDVNYSIINNEIVRDSVTNLPIIPSSGVKGALREHCEGVLKDKLGVVKNLFGSDIDNENKASQPGSLKFFPANMLARPLRVSEGDVSYIRCTTPEIINDFISLAKILGIFEIDNCAIPENIPSAPPSFFTNYQGINKIEGINATPYNGKDEAFLKSIIGETFALTGTATFSSFDLPVIPRNHLDNGISDNLWYEEYVPHKSVFYFVILGFGSDENENAFDEIINRDIIQFGGNATIGCGYMKIQKVGESK